MNKEFILDKLVLIGAEKESALKYLDFIYSCDESKCEEKHHILPKSLFPEFTNLKKYDWNMRQLTYVEHLESHKLLYHSLKHKKEMTYAFWLMATIHKNLSSEEYEFLKNDVILKIKEYRARHHIKEKYSRMMKEHNILWDNPEVIEFCRLNYWTNDEWLDKNMRGQNNPFAIAIQDDPELRQLCSEWMKTYHAQPGIKEKYAQMLRDKPILSDPSVYQFMVDNYWTNEEWKEAHLYGDNNSFIKAMRSDPTIKERHRESVTNACSTLEQRAIRSKNSKEYANRPEVKEANSARLKANNPMSNPEISAKTAGDNHITRRIKEPWRKSSATRPSTRHMWSHADILYAHWKDTNCSRYHLKTVTGIHVSEAIINYFRNGWIPSIDSEWHKDFKS